jgi:serine/threonine-protein kinase
MVTDFGIAKALSTGSGATLTGVGVAIGTPAFMSPEQAAGERDIDGRSDLYSLGVVSYQMLTGELPFSAPSVAGILMKQITEPAPDLRIRRPDIPEDLALAVARCLEKDPSNRWPTADALRRALEARTVNGYQPTGLGWKAGERSFSRSPSRPPAGGRSPLERPRVQPRGSPGLPDVRRPRELNRAQRRDARRGRSDQQIPDTGEPKIIQRVRGQFASWAAVTAGCMGINVATGIEHPWFLFPMFGMGIGLLRNYATLWQAGYSWRDVLSRPPAPDSLETTMVKGKAARPLPSPTAEEFGGQLPAILQVYGDRLAILKLMAKLPVSERKMLPEIQQTADALYARATDLARTLHAMDTNLDSQEVAAIDERIAGIAREPDDPERARRLGLLQRQRQTITDLRDRRSQVASHLESCVLAMQNVRFDLLRLRSAGVAAVLDDLTQATQQAKALSRDVDNVIAAAGEIREVMK